MNKHYVIDTNVLVDDPSCLIKLRNGSENEIYIPYTVILELDKLKDDKRLSYMVSKSIDELKKYEWVKFLSPYKEERGNGDLHIINEIKNSTIEHPIVITNDKLFRIVCEYHKIQSEEYMDSLPYESESQIYTGFVDENEIEKPYNSFMWCDGKVYRNLPDSKKILINHEHQIWEVKPRNIYQNLALELLNDDQVHLVSMQSKAGYGKSYLSLAVALYKVFQEKKYNHIYLFKPTIEIGDSLGFLPGNIKEKIDPYIDYLITLIHKLHKLRKSPNGKIFQGDTTSDKLVLNPEIFKIFPIQYIRGMNIDNSFVIVDECQNLSRTEVRSLLTRMGNNVKCVCLGDVEQIDNRYLNIYNNGLNWIVKTCKGEPSYGHIVLKGDKSRGPICDMIIRNHL